jgi:hypothetical protein
VARDCIGQIAVGKGGRRKASLIEADYLVLVPREAIATQSFLKAKDVDCRCLLPASVFRSRTRCSGKIAGFGPPAILTLANRPITVPHKK